MVKLGAIVLNTGSKHKNITTTQLDQDSKVSAASE